VSEWFSLIPAVLYAIVLLVVPGLGIAWLAGFRGYGLVGGAAGAAFGVVAVASLVAPFVGLQWSILPVLIVAVALTALMAGVVGIRRRTREPHVVLRGGVKPVQAWLAAGATAVAWAGILVVGMGAPSNPAQHFDAIFHLNAVQFVLDTGSASPLDMTMTTPGRDHALYPTLWHSFVSLIVPVAGGVVPATNALTIGAIAVVWPAAIGMLTRVAFPMARAAWVLAPVATLGFALFPLGFLNWGVLYPNLLGNLLIPVLLALAALVLRPWGRKRVTMTSLVLLAMLTAFGAALAHPSSLLAALALSAPLCIAVIARVWKRRTAQLSTKILVTAGLIGALGLLGVAWLRFGVSGGEWEPYQSFAQSLGEAVFLGPVGRPPALFVFALALVGARVAWRTRASWIIGVQIMAAGFFLVASWLREQSLRALVVGIWYDDVTRVAALLVIAALPLAAVGAWEVIRIVPVLWRDRSRIVAFWRIAAAVLAVIVLGGFQAQLLRTEVSYMRGVSFAFSDESQGLSPDEAAMFAEVARLIPEGSLVAGNPLTGAGLLYAYEGIHVLFPHIKGDFGADAALIGRELRSGSPQVCDAVEREGVTHVLDFGNVMIFPTLYDPVYAGLNRLSRSAILTPVTSIGDVVLYEITGCR